MKTAHTLPTSIDEYIAGFPRNVRTLLGQVRRAIREAVPGADEVISYRIPTYKLHGRPVIYFAAFKEHYSIYPSTAPLIAAFKDRLEPYEYNNKGTIRFPLSAPVPVRLLADIAKFRARDVEARDKAKTAPARGSSGRRRTVAARPKRTGRA
jgi:uncharacterized protein YdhG (YjbR/CyaY superfamily)